jgi:hypothetical protein
MAGLLVTHHAARLTTLIAVASSASMGRHCDVGAGPAATPPMPDDDHADAGRQQRGQASDRSRRGRSPGTLATSRITGTTPISRHARADHPDLRATVAHPPEKLSILVDGAALAGKRRGTRRSWTLPNALGLPLTPKGVCPLPSVRVLELLGQLQHPTDIRRSVRGQRQAPWPGTRSRKAAGGHIRSAVESAVPLPPRRYERRAPRPCRSPPTPPLP